MARFQKFKDGGKLIFVNTGSVLKIEISPRIIQVGLQKKIYSETESVLTIYYIDGGEHQVHGDLRHITELANLLTGVS